MLSHTFICIRKILNYNQEEIGLVATLANGGTWAGVLGGLLYDRVGPRPTALLASVFVFLGYFLMYLATKGLVNSSPGVVGLFAFMMGQGSGWAYTVALNTSVINFVSKDRGTVSYTVTFFFF
jgi:MFS family permease